MVAANEFWLALHQFAGAYGREGETPDERFKNALIQFRKMPSIARRELLADFALLAGNIPELYTACNAAHHEADRAERNIAAGKLPVS